MSQQRNASSGSTRGRGTGHRKPFHGNKNAPTQQRGSKNTRGSYSMTNLYGEETTPHLQNHGGRKYFNAMPHQQVRTPLLGYAPPQYQHIFTGNRPNSSFMPESGPPPPYEKAMEQVSKKKPKAEALVKALVMFTDHWATADTIRKQIECDVKDIEALVKSNGKIFSMMKNGNQLIIELTPKLGICMDYLSDEGCVLRDNCMNLHICKFFVVTSCIFGNSCQFGHKWDTSHNTRVLSKFYLDLVDWRVLHGLIRRLCKGIIPPKICSFYNSKNGCRHGDQCGMLHICKDFVMNVGKCLCTSYNHDILTPQSRRILLKHDIPVNESPRDIIMSLKAVLETDDEEKASSLHNPNRRTEENQKEKGEIKQEKGQLKVKKKTNTVSDATKIDLNNEDISVKSKKNTNERAKQDQSNLKGKGKAFTFKSTDTLGDVKIPEICIFSIDGKCRNEKKGCMYLHARSLFHWQAEKNQHWYNFRVYQSKILETAFRDVSKGSVAVAPLIENKLDENAKELLTVFGREAWTADFQRMNIRSSSGQECLPIRRIATKSAAESTNPKATVYDWYFIDDQGQWVQYGKVDSVGKQEFICSITSKEIEKQYISDPSSSIEYSNSKYKYKLDFSRMKQTNLKTLKEREVRRRPSCLAYQKSDPKEDVLPSSWSPMAANQTHVLHLLDANSAEYKTVAMFLRMSLPSISIVKIQRLQNPYLWKLFQYKQADLSKRYDENQLNIQKLFHSVDQHDIDTISKENIDWRQGMNTSHQFGRGAYFSNRAAVTRKYCTPDSRGHIYMFMAQVIVGSVIKGSPELTRPPINQLSKELYDTTVDDVHNATIFVKYDKEDYYPEYLIECY